MSTVTHVLVSDCHGSFYTLVRLLNRVVASHPGAQLILLGDLIDRGPHSRQVVEFAMSNAIPTVMGNHEHLALAYYDLVPWRGFYAHKVWLHNGGENTLGNWPVYDSAGVAVGNDVPKDVLAWMQALPYYLKPDAALDSRGRRLLVSHTGYGLDVDGKGRDLWFRALWGRHSLGDGDFEDDGWFRPIGHTKVKEPMVDDDHGFAYVDTGAAYRGYGTLTAFLWPTKTVVQQQFDESPIKPTFKVKDGCLVPNVGRKRRCIS